MMTTPQKRRSTKKKRINRAAKNQKREEEGNDYSKPIINMDLHLTWATETGHSLDLAR